MGAMSSRRLLMGEGRRPVPGAEAPGKRSTPVALATAPASSAVPPTAGRVVGNRVGLLLLLAIAVLLQGGCVFSARLSESNGRYWEVANEVGKDVSTCTAIHAGVVEQAGVAYDRWVLPDLLDKDGRATRMAVLHLPRALPGRGWVEEGRSELPPDPDHAPKATVHVVVTGHGESRGELPADEVLADDAGQALPRTIDLIVTAGRDEADVRWWHAAERRRVLVTADLRLHAVVRDRGTLAARRMGYLVTVPADAICVAAVAALIVAIAAL
jgi:hypothetical protein